MDSLTSSAVSVAARQERESRRAIRTDFLAWTNLALASQNFSPALHHRRIIAELGALASGTADRLMLLLPPGSAKSTYASMNTLLGTVSAMAMTVISYWVGSSAGSARKDERLAQLKD